MSAMTGLHQEQHVAFFTCLSCTTAFTSAEDQREHYKSDHHRYNMKRRVAGLPPVSTTVFNQKVLERKAETAITVSPKGSACDACGKSYTTENAYRNHLSSRKHRENELKAASKPKVPYTERTSSGTPTEVSTELAEVPSQRPITVALSVDANATEEQIEQTIDEKVAAARARLSPNQCLFCSSSSDSPQGNLTHMLNVHSFFVPDAEYLVDLVGLIAYLGEKIAVGNVCIFCNQRGREFRTHEAVRKHMIDKGHCKVAYDSEEERLEVSDFYDFTSSYPDAQEPKKNNKRAKAEGETDAHEEWEEMDVDDDGDVDEVVDEEASDEESEAEDDLLDNQVTYGDSQYELVLPSGARIGHRSMRLYYEQSLPRIPRSGKVQDPNSGAALVRRLLADSNNALVPRKGGFGAFGGGTDVVKARNRGEAREAGRHVREFRDQRRREDFKTKIGFINNNQKHFRDPLLQ